MKTQEIVHQWAQQNGDSGECGNVFYEGKTIYSYGYHFKLAQFYDEIVLVNSDGYSSTTSKHQSYVRGAISHLESVRVPNLFKESYSATAKNGAHKVNIKYILGEIDKNIQGLSTARIKERYIDYIQHLVDQLRQYCHHMSVPQSCINKQAQELISAGFIVSDEMLQTIRDKKKADKIKAEAKARREAKAWINHRNEKSFHSSDPVFLRLSELSDKVETSQGVSVPIDEARLLFAVVKRSAINGTSLNAEQLNGCGKIGYYDIDRVVKGDITAGCHHIKYQEIQDFAKRVNW